MNLVNPYIEDSDGLCRQRSWNRLNIPHAISAVTRAAERLNLTQPAVSNALTRARVLLNDPLLVREGRSLVPTPLALQLEPMLADLLIDLRALWARHIPWFPGTWMCTSPWARAVMFIPCSNSCFAIIN